MKKLRLPRIWSHVCGAMKLLVLVLLAACGTAATTSSQHGTLTLDSIPQPASAALRRAAGDAKIEEIEREGDAYEASWHVGGLEREAVVSASGELVKMEEEVPSTQVPPAVRAAAIIKLANAQSMKFVKLQSGNFEVEAMVDGKEHEVTLAPDGRDVRGDADDDDDDGDHDD